MGGCGGLLCPVLRTLTLSTPRLGSPAATPRMHGGAPLTNQPSLIESLLSVHTHTTPSPSLRPCPLPNPNQVPRCTQCPHPDDGQSKLQGRRCSPPPAPAAECTVVRKQPPGIHPVHPRPPLIPRARCPAAALISPLTLRLGSPAATPRMVASSCHPEPLPRHSERRPCMQGRGSRQGGQGRRITDGQGEAGQLPP